MSVELIKIPRYLFACFNSRLGSAVNSVFLFSVYWKTTCSYGRNISISNKYFSKVFLVSLQCYAVWDSYNNFR